MIRNFTLIFLFLFSLTTLSAQGLTIQENEIGFCSIDGIIDTDVSGYTGDGFANGSSGIGTSALWNISVPTDGTYHIYWRYANGGGAGDLDAEVWVNETPFNTNFSFTHTGAWTNWVESDTIAVNLIAGENRIRLVSLISNGLANIDYFHVIEDGVSPAFCVPSYSFSLSKNLEQGGMVSYEPVQPFYDAGSEITLTASANPGYFFQSWSGGETSDELVHTFNINRNVDVEALFYPEGIEAVEGVKGYATVQDDEGTPFLMTGGMLGDTVLVTNFNQLKNFLESDQPYVVTVADHIISTGQINVKSDKTLLGITDEAHLEGIRIKINGADNVIFQNMTLSKVVQFDVLEINNSHHVWIDNCEFFTDLDNGSEFYDGLLDIKNAAAFITVSNTEFHDHFKAVLISSGDDSVQDTTIRITFHHNYFHHLGSRTPLLRFGKAHIFNNYFQNCSSGINSRMDACIRVEKNFFYQVSNATRTDMSIVVGSFQLIDNIFIQSNHVTKPICELNVPYEYLSILDNVDDVPMIVAGENPVSVQETFLDFEINIFPNPTDGQVKVVFDLPNSTKGEIKLLDLTGREVKFISDKQFFAGENQIQFSTERQSPGLYFLQIRTETSIAVEPLVIK